MCVNCASTDLWGAWVGNHPGLPGVSHAAYAAPGMMKMGSSRDSFERAGGGSEAV